MRLLRRAGWDVERHGLFGRPGAPRRGRATSRTSRSSRRSRCWAWAGSGCSRVPTDGQGRMRADALRGGPRGPRPTRARVRPGRQREHGRIRPPAADRRRGRARTAAGSTSTAPSGSGRPRTPCAGTSSPGCGRGGLLDDRCPQVAQRAVRLRARRSSRDPAAHHAAMTLGAAYYVETTGCASGTRTTGSPSPRAGPAASPCWAAVRSLGRSGLAEMIGRTCDLARPLRPADSTAWTARGSSTTSCSTRCWSGSRHATATRTVAGDARTDARDRRRPGRRHVLAGRHPLA